MSPRANERRAFPGDSSGLAGARLPWFGRVRQAADYAAAARAMLASRRKMEHFFPALFADPARDMLLDLFVAVEEDRNLSVTSCCIAAMVPPTTALRWLSLLKAQGLVLEEPDTRDRRQKLLRLAPQAREQMRLFFDAIELRRTSEASAPTK